MVKSETIDLSHAQKATFASGCFWGLQEELRQIPGVVKTTVGYTGGTKTNSTYKQIASRKTDHVEAVEVFFDPTKVSYETLLNDFMNPNRPDGKPGRTRAGTNSIIFYTDAAQQQAVEHWKNTLNQSSKLGLPIATQIKAASEFYPAEEFHQDYYRKTAAQHACQLQ